MSDTQIFTLRGIRFRPVPIKVMIRLDDADTAEYSLEENSLLEPLLHLMFNPEPGTYTQGEGDGAYFVDLHFRGQIFTTLDLLHTTITLYPCICQSLDSSTEA